MSFNKIRKKLQNIINLYLFQVSSKMFLDCCNWRAMTQNIEKLWN